MNISQVSLPELYSKEIKGSRLSTIPQRYNAYNRILEAEQHAVEQKVEKNVMAARIVGHLFLEFDARREVFGDAPCAALASWVLSHPRDTARDPFEVVFDIGRACRDTFIRSFQTSTERCSSPSSPPSRPSFDTLEDMTKDVMASRGTDHRTWRNIALARDGYRCVITGMVDRTSLRRCVELKDAAMRDRVMAVPIHTAHVFKPMGHGEESKAANESGAMGILKSFGLSKLADAFMNSGGIHQVWNLLSLEPLLHGHFDSLDLWFERTRQSHRYIIRVSDPAIESYICREACKPDPMVVDFTSTLEQLPPPDPALLDLHAVCARVAHMSGASEYFDQLQSDAEETQTLAFDGSSAVLLTDLLSPLTGSHSGVDE